MMDTKIVEEELIDVVRSEPCLYDSTHPNFTRKNLKLAVWNRIASVVGFKNGMDAKKIWLNLRNNLRASLRRQKTAENRSPRGRVRFKPWRYQERMAYLIPHLGNISTIEPRISTHNNQAIDTTEKYGDDSCVEIYSSEDEQTTLYCNEESLKSLSDDETSTNQPKDIKPFRRNTLDDILCKSLEEHQQARTPNSFNTTDTAGSDNDYRCMEIYNNTDNQGGNEEATQSVEGSADRDTSMTPLEDIKPFSRNTIDDILCKSLVEHQQARTSNSFHTTDTAESDNDYRRMEIYNNANNQGGNEEATQSVQGSADRDTSMTPLEDIKPFSRNTIDDILCKSLEEHQQARTPFTTDTAESEYDYRRMETYNNTNYQGCNEEANQLMEGSADRDTSIAETGDINPIKGNTVDDLLCKSLEEHKQIRTQKHVTDTAEIDNENSFMEFYKNAFNRVSKLETNLSLKDSSETDECTYDSEDIKPTLRNTIDDLLTKSLEKQQQILATKRQRESTPIAQPTNDYTVNNVNNDPLFHFFMSMYETTKRLPAQSQLKIKSKTFALVSHEESKMIMKSQTSALYSNNGLSSDAES